jgi:RNA polymerase sigma-70 factor (ECF subfamily)
MQPEAIFQQRFEECVECCADSLFRVAYRLTGNRTLASELVQETYLNAWKSIGTLNDSDRMRAWMFSILRNQFTKLLRDEKRNPSTAENLGDVSLNDASTMRPSNNEQVDRVQAALATLDEKHKLPVLLVSLEGMTVEEAASVLDIPRGTVLSRLHRGRQKLKEVLSRDQSRTEQS